jgi:uncharacterized protein (DUF58 family)
MIGGAIRAYNLPLVLAGLVVATMLLQWRWIRHSVSAISVQRRLPGEAFAGQPFTVAFVVTNRSRWLPGWLIRIDDRIRRIEVAARTDRRGRKRDLADPAIEASCGVGVVPCLRWVTATYTCVITRRGRYDFGHVTVSSGAPLGLLLGYLTQKKREMFYVFPQRAVLRRHWRRQLQNRLGGNSTGARRSGVTDGEFFGIRGWQEGDSRRWIHWRTTARIGEPAVRQFEQHRRFEVCLLVDAYIGSSSSGSDGAHGSDDSAVERIISVASTLVTQLVATPSNRIGLVLAGKQAIALSSGGGREQTLAMLSQLAEMSGSPTPELGDAIRQMFRIAGRPRDLVVLSTRRPEDAAAQTSSGRVSEMFGSGLVWRWFSTADSSIDQIAMQSNDETVTLYRDSIDVVEKVSDPDGRNGPPGAAHHRGQTPFPKTQMLTSRGIEERQH